MSAAYDLRATVRAEVAARVAENDAAAALRRTLRRALRAVEARAEWDHLVTMLGQPGRPVPAAHVRTLARAAKVSAADLAAALASPQVAPGGAPC